ncbi:MAG: peptidoglycan DD-metalloendopeptidase family protein [Anaerolineae bacterium]|nr:peptidoglycan DD-metalloendopeptidase family protein [Phycisphaerae bacterium]
MVNFSQYSFHPVIALPPKYELFDFENDPEAFRASTSPYAIGRYNEKRAIYTTELFREAARCIHVGIDIGGPVGTECRAFFEGSVFLQGYNAAAGDYGYTIITRHELNGVELFALWGHLSKASIELRDAGDSFRAGDVIAYLGDRHENGGWNPHLHFQLSYEKPTKPDMPGVVSEADRSAALEIYPDPRLVLGPLY